MTLRGGDLRRKQLELERGDHRLRDLVLHREDVGELAVVGLRPEVVAVGGADELGCDADLVAGLAHASLEDRRDIQLGGDGPHVFVLALEREGGGSRGHVQAGHFCEQVEQLLGEAVGEIILVGIAAQVEQRQDGDRRGDLRRRALGRRRRPCAKHEVVDQPRRGSQHADAEEDGQEPGAPQTSGRGPLDAAGVDVENPRQGDDDGKAGGERDHHVREHLVGPAQAVHDRLDDLEHREGRDAVAHQRAEDPPALQLGDQEPRVHDADGSRLHAIFRPRHD